MDNLYVVDQGSSDGSHALYEKFRARGLRVHRTRLDVRHRAAVLTRLMRRHRRGARVLISLDADEFVCLDKDGGVHVDKADILRAIASLPADVFKYLFPDHLQTLVGAFRRRGRAPRVGLAWSDMYVAPAAGDGVGTRHGSFGPPAPGSIDSSEMMTSRAALSAAGGWTRGRPSRDPAWRDLRCDDYLLARRIVEAGFEWVHVPRVTVQYWTRDAVLEDTPLDNRPRPPLPRRVPSLAEFPEAP